MFLMEEAIPIKVDGSQVNVFYMEAALAETKPKAGFRTFVVNGIIAYDRSGNSYWRPTADAPWERC